MLFSKVGTAVMAVATGMFNFKGAADIASVYYGFHLTH